jgi:hypothetical protein
MIERVWRMNQVCPLRRLKRIRGQYTMMVTTAASLAVRIIRIAHFDAHRSQAMTRNVTRITLLALLAGATSPALVGGEVDEKKESQKQPESIVIIDPDDVADADFAIQGEYAGTVVDDGQTIPSGAQVIALGDHKFRAVAYPGGLPGDGWVQGEVIIVDGVTENGVTEMSGDAGSGTVIDGSEIVIHDANGQRIGTLERVTRKSPTLGKRPPRGAVVLFDGSSADAFLEGRITDDHLLAEGTTSTARFQDFSLHLEFMLSYMPDARGQGRSNSGCYLQGRYEVQILDSFGLEGEDNECGAIYGVRRPGVNMCFPPLTWQTYDVDFTAARYDGAGTKTANARMTVRHNGVVVHDDVEVPGATRAAPVAEGPEPGPIHLQDHGNPLRFRNIWVVENE